jgi:hypothetical protein
MKLISQLSEFNSKLYKILNFAAVWTNQKIKKQSTAIGSNLAGASCTVQRSAHQHWRQWPMATLARGAWWPTTQVSHAWPALTRQRLCRWHWIAEMEALWLWHFGVQSEGRRGASLAAEWQLWLAASRGDNRYKLQHQRPAWKGSTVWGTTSMVKKTRWHCVAA